MLNLNSGFQLWHASESPRGFVKTYHWDLRVSDSVGLGETQEFAFLTNSQIMLMTLSGNLTNH